MVIPALRISDGDRPHYEKLWGQAPLVRWWCRMGTGPITKSYGDRPHSLGGGVKSLVYYFDEVALFASKTDGLAFVRER